MKKYTNADRNWIYDPETVSVNRLPAHSDHQWKSGEGSTDTTDRVLLNGSWYFAWAETPESGDTEFYKEKRDLSEMGEITVPGCLELQGYGQVRYTNSTYEWDGAENLIPPQIPVKNNPVGRYIRTVNIPEEWNGKQIVIRFDGVGSAMFLWVNGRFAGYNEGSFTPAEFDITEYLHQGENRIAVEAVKYCTGSWMEDQDFFRYSGIFRDVTLFALPEMHVEDVFVWTEKIREDAGSARISAAIKYRLRTDTGCLHWIVTDENGKTAAEEICAGFPEKLDITVKDPLLWNAEEPHLYELKLILQNDRGETVEKAKVSFGIRTVEVKDSMLLVNGRRIVFRGVNRHEFSLTGGRTVTAEEMLLDIRFMKENNINAVRTCHYPDVSLWYELCDKHGVYLIDETNLESHGSWATAHGEDPEYNVPGSRQEWTAAALDRVTAMLERDKNHPSVIMWSLGNESYAGDVMRKMYQLFHARDSRPVHYEGVCHCREYDDISDVESRMYLPPDGCEEYLKNDPDKPFLLCEYMHAMGNSLGGMKAYTDLEKYPQYAGGFIWDYIDQAALLDEDGACRTAYGGDFGDYPNAGNFCGDGIIYADRTISPKVCEAKALYAPVSIAAETEFVTVRNRNFFTDTSGYRFIAELYENGGKTAEREISVPSAAPGETVRAEHGFAEALLKAGSGKEMLVRVRALTACGTEMVPAGHEIAFGEFVCGKYSGRESGERADDYEIIKGGDIVGVRGKDFLIRFPLGQPFQLSARYDGKEIFRHSHRIALWRALTDNDRGNAQQFRLASAKAAEYGQYMTHAEYTETDGLLTVKYEISLPKAVGEAVKGNLSYKVRRDGSIDVIAELPAGSGFAEIPAFGVSMELRKEFSEVSWYGYGPEENYPDRNHGVKLERFVTSAAELPVKYLKPQECGNHTGVREIRVTDQNGSGVCFSMLDCPLNASVLPYSAEELENAYHSYDLPQQQAVHVRILAAIEGVGGIDSWGALPQDSCRIFPENGFSLTFRMRPVRSTKSIQ
ncbi:MAG: DUF4981 domain-containing protein [Lachnospiraceae bacterium]|nr:DUF4981 domain-containing protein [Lachnospiraceae bacterium]